MLSTHSAPALAGERWWRQPPKGVPLFPRPPGRLYGFFILAPLLFEGCLPQLCAKRCSPSIHPLAPRAGRPDGCHTPLCAEGAGPYGNTATPPTGIYCQWHHLLHAPRSFAALRMTVDGGALPSHQPLATSQGGCKGFIILAAEPPTTTLSGKAAVKL